MVRALLALVAVGGMTALLDDLGTDSMALTAHAAYLVLAVVLPGTLVHKALRGTMGDWLSDLALGAGLGLILELIAWMLFSALDIREALWAWPLLTLALLAPRSVRRRVTERPRDPWPLVPLVGVATAALGSFTFVATTFGRSVRPLPSDTAYPADLQWHMGLVSEARRAFPLGTPQVVGEGTLKYHWFADAHLAAASLITGNDVPTLMTRLWWGPITVLGVLLVAVLARHLSRSGAAGATAALLMASVSTAPWWPGVVDDFPHLNPISPSQLYAHPLAILAVHSLADLLRGHERARSIRRDMGTASVAAAAVVGSAGAKPSTLPLLTAALALTVVVALVLHRDRVRALVLTLATGAVMVAGLVVVAGGRFGQEPQLLHALTLLNPYRVLRPDPVEISAATIPGLTGSTDWNLLGPLLAVMAFVAVRQLAFVLPLFDKVLRRDLAAWLIAGVSGASIAPFLLLGHRGYSEYYFLYGAVPFGSVLWSWFLVRVAGRNPASRTVTIATTLAVGVPTIVAFMTRDRPITTSDAAATALQHFATSIMVATCLLVIAVAVVATLGRRRSWRPVVAPIVPVLLLTPMALGAVVPNVQRLVDPPPSTLAPRPLLLDQTIAAEWIQRNVPEEDLMATNVQCFHETGRTCAAWSWWISGLGGRRVLIEGWNYAPRAALHGYPDAGRHDLNQAAFEAPTAEGIAELEKLGVRWLVAQDLPGHPPVSMLLPYYASLRERSGRYAIYELPH